MDKKLLEMQDHLKALLQNAIDDPNITNTQLKNILEKAKNVIDNFIQKLDDNSKL